MDLINEGGLFDKKYVQYYESKHPKVPKLKDMKKVNGYLSGGKFTPAKELKIMERLSAGTLVTMYMYNGKPHSYYYPCTTINGTPSDYWYDPYSFEAKSEWDYYLLSFKNTLCAERQSRASAFKKKLKEEMKKESGK